MTSLYGSTEYHDTYLYPINKRVISKPFVYPQSTILEKLQNDATTKKFFYMIRKVSMIDDVIFTNCTLCVVPDKFLNLDVSILDSYDCLRILRHHIIPQLYELGEIINYKPLTLDGDNIEITNKDVLVFKKCLDGNLLFINNLKIPTYYF
jgi:hypothetical protein